jgi:hypothetical protein
MASPKQATEIGPISVEVLRGEDVFAAERLLYDIYVTELKWVPTLGNPSGFRVDATTNGALGLTDDYSHLHDTVWIGALDSNKQLVGCCRLSPRHPVTKKLDVENYTNLPSHISKIQNIYETSRLAVLPSYRNKGIVTAKLGLKLFKVMLDGVGACVIATATNSVKNVFILIGGSDLHHEFKYESRDQKVSKCFLFESKNSACHSLINPFFKKRFLS